MMNNKDDLCSKYNPYLSFKSETANYINKNLITPKIKYFFDIRKIKKYAEVDSKNYISDLDFMSIKFSLFYTHLLQDINRDENGSIVLPIKYCITIDPFLCTKTCATTKIKYDEICLGKTPVLYYIFIDITEIMECARQSEKQAINVKV
ncbi:hypothetical protein FK216_02900 [Moraxellaceae bacterium AER2_44_116]|nr:hypothetical protein [Moraxellaceae bacterium]TQC99203.1 hypothetical protein FK216_02900 [Moraxellaceae bacterium AER2_44_116]